MRYITKVNNCTIEANSLEELTAALSHFKPGSYRVEIKPSTKTRIMNWLIDTILVAFFSALFVGFFLYVILV